MKRSLAVCTVLLLSASLCLAAGVNESTASGGGAEERSRSTVSGKPAVPFAETFEFSMLEAIHQAEEENAVESLIMEATNTRIDYIKVPRTNFNEKLNITLASGQLPDVVSFLWKPVVPQAWVDQGAVIALDELLEDYGANITRHWKPELMPYLKRQDGKIYSVKALNGFSYYESLMIRRDWVEDLGMGMPETVDDWESLLSAIKRRDPNGNKMSDEVPWIGTLDPWFAAYGIYGSDSYVLLEGRLVTRYEHPNYKDALLRLQGMFKGGLIDTEYSIRDLDSQFELLSTHKAAAGMFSGVEATRMTKLMRETDPDAIFCFTPPIKGPGGMNIAARAPFGTSTSITVQASDPVKCMLFLDYMFSDQGIEYTNFGQEGVHHVKVNGQPHLLAPYSNGFEHARKVGIAKGTWPIYWTAENYLQILFSGKTADDLDEIGRLSYDAYTKNAEYFYYSLPGSIFQTETNIKLSADIWNPLKDMESKVILGLAEWDNMESLIAELKTYGMDKITGEVNRNYQSTK